MKLSPFNFKKCQEQFEMKSKNKCKMRKNSIIKCTSLFGVPEGGGERWWEEGRRGGRGRLASSWECTS